MERKRKRDGKIESYEYTSWCVFDREEDRKKERNTCGRERRKEGETDRVRQYERNREM